jgi:PAS domain S-box/PAS domain S-box
MTDQTRLHVEQQKDARRVMTRLGKVMRGLQDLNICIGREALPGMASGLRTYEQQLALLKKELRSLRSALAYQPRYARTVDEIESTCNTVGQIYSRYRSGKLAGQNIRSDGVRTGATGMELAQIYMSANDVLVRLESIQADFRQVERESQEHLRFQSSLLFNATLFMGFLATVVVAFLLYHIFISGIIGRLRAVGRTLDDVAKGKPVLEPILGSGDEIDFLASELLSMERSLRKMRSKEKTLLENSASCLCSIDAERRFVKVSQASTILWGIEPRELLGQPLSSLVHPDDVKSVSERIDELFQSRSSVEFECRVTHSSGTIVEFAWTASIAEEQNLAVCVAHDVTSRNEINRQVEQRDAEFQSMIDSMPIAVVTCDQAAAITSINPATQAMLHYSPQDLLGENLSSLLFGGTAAGVTTSEQMSEVLSEAEKRPIEFMVWRADGSRLPVEFNSRHYELHDSQVHLATFKDVSARFEIETVKKDFVAMISHDLRSPLTAVHGTLEVIGLNIARSGSELSADVLGHAEDVASAQNIVYSIVNVLNDFLDLEKFEAGAIALELHEISLADLVSDLREKLKVASVRASVTVNLDGESVSKSRACVDVERLLFAITTIVQVAACYRKPESAAPITVSVVTSDHSINFLIDEFDVPDHIEAALHTPYLFLSDAKLSGSVSSGLALSLSRAVLLAHAGSAHVERTDGACSISIELPVAH